MHTLLTRILPIALFTSILLAPVYAQSLSTASVAVVEVETGSIMGANSIDTIIPANLAGRIGFAILAYEWMDTTQTHPDTQLEGGPSNLTIREALTQLLMDGREGEMARALMAAHIGYTPATLNSATNNLMTEIGAETKNIQVQRSANGGPEWTGTITTRDTARMGVALARLHGTKLQKPVQASAGLQCIAIEPGNTTTPPTNWVAVVNGAISPEGCILAASNAIQLTNTRMAENIRITTEPTSPTNTTNNPTPITGITLP